jgi:hypothetical protein
VCDDWRLCDTGACQAGCDKYANPSFCHACFHASRNMRSQINMQQRMCGFLSCNSENMVIQCDASDGGYASVSMTNGIKIPAGY